MQAADRRSAPRFRIRIPLHFRLENSSEPEFAAETLDVSSAGVCMETDAPPRVGAVLLVRVRLPEMITGCRVPEWNIMGQVIHVRLSAEPDKYGVGVQFHYYEATAIRRSRAFAKLGAPGMRLMARS